MRSKTALKEIDAPGYIHNYQFQFHKYPGTFYENFDELVDHHDSLLEVQMLQLSSKKFVMKKD